MNLPYFPPVFWYSGGFLDALKQAGENPTNRTRRAGEQVIAST